MILESVISFFGGSLVRTVIGEVVTALKNRQEVKREIAMMELQGKLDAERHVREVEMLKLQREQGMEVIRVKGEQDIELANEQAWGKAVQEAMKPSGIWLIDAWNGSIRPAAASFALYLWVASVHSADYAMKGRDWEIVFAILGYFFADRHLGKRGR